IFSTSVNINNSNGPTAIATTVTDARCGNSNGTLTLGAVTGGVAPYTYSIDAGAYSNTTSYTNLAAGSHSVDVKDANGCIFSTTATVTVAPIAVPMRYPTITVNANTATQLNARSLGSNYTYQWAPPAGLNAYNTISPIFNYDRPSEYMITITSDKGCSVTDTLLVKINPIDAPPITEDIFVPKAWSPNGDGHNDLLRPLPVNMRELKFFRIFNRWGELVYESNAFGQGWNGIYKGKPQVMDTYTWIAEGVGLSGKIIKRTGNSVLLR
ncbi:MAG TPA: gliding motility-associated C-terminal domain-containing protein, partial [Chitinophagaceae bacterium]|nr:gliding motility-associated C-terminal domain-containing protein [Chitinophagaceae bacterium]